MKASPGSTKPVDVLDLADGGDAERASDDRDMAGGGALLEHQAAQSGAIKSSNAAGPMLRATMIALFGKSSCFCADVRPVS